MAGSSPRAPRTSSCGAPARPTLSRPSSPSPERRHDRRKTDRHVSPRRIAAVAERIALGFRRDRRSLALLFVAPLVVLSLVGAVWGTSANVVPTVAVATDRVGVPPILSTRLVDTLVQASDIKAHRATFDEGIQELKDGKSDAVLWIEG